MKKTSLNGIGLLIAGIVLAVPMVAQQEVDPDHFDSQARVAQNRKPASGKHKLASMHSRHTTVSHVRSKSQSGSQAAAKPEPVTVAANDKSR
jgi:hypothetical protein